MHRCVTHVHEEVGYAVDPVSGGGPGEPPLCAAMGPWALRHKRPPPLHCCLGANSLTPIFSCLAMYTSIAR